MYVGLSTLWNLYDLKKYSKSRRRSIERTQATTTLRSSLDLLRAAKVLHGDLWDDFSRLSGVRRKRVRDSEVPTERDHDRQTDRRILFYGAVKLQEGYRTVWVS